MVDILERVAAGDDMSDFSDLSGSDDEEWTATNTFVPDDPSDDDETDFCCCSAVAHSSLPRCGWNKALLQSYHPDFSGTFSEPDDVETPIIISRKLLTNDMLKLLVEQSNLYRVQKYGTSVNTNVSEVEQVWHVLTNGPRSNAKREVLLGAGQQASSYSRHNV